MISIFKKTIIFILTIESRLVLKKYKPAIIAVTGSVGKTSAKDAIYAILASTDSKVRKSEKSFNSEIGVPLTILGIGNAWKNPLDWLSNILHGLELIVFETEYPDTLVLEVGADHPGDIKKLTRWLKPDIAVITKIGDIPVHVEFFDSPEAVLVEKIYLAKAVVAGGTVALYTDDEKLRDLKFNDRKVMSYGMISNALIKGSLPTISYKEDDGLKKPIGISFKLEYAGNSVPISLPGVLGIQHVYPILASVTVGLARGLSFMEVINAIPRYEPPRGRMNIIEGINDSTLIDDSYNSSPAALLAALGALVEIKDAKRKIVVIGDMMELGSYSAIEHHRAGELVARSVDTTRGDFLVTVGQRAKGIRDGAIAAGMDESFIISFNDSTEAAGKMRDIIKAGDIVLVKGSQSPRLERITKSLLLEPEKAYRLLVRQEKEWLDKK